jgi:hypothetical protein
VLGTLGGIGLLIGRSGCCRKMEARSGAGRRAALAWTPPSSSCCS